MSHFVKDQDAARWRWRAIGKICLWAAAACESMETVDFCGDKLNWRRLRETLC
jgi:hypothetical protein